METYHDYNIDIDSFEFCTRRKCPLRKKCLRKVQPPNASPYWVRGGNYDKQTNSCKLFIDKEQYINQPTEV